VKNLEELSSAEAILARVSETDFAIFNVVNDPASYKTSIQTALIGLCQMPEYIEAGLMVTVGESRAHLGFNNPESMIQHACDSINISFANLKEVNQSSSENSDPTITDANSQLDEAIMIDEAANTVLDSKDFSSL
jgi:hypothetical protein